MKKKKKVVVMKKKVMGEKSRDDRNCEVVANPLSTFSVSSLMQYSGLPCLL